MNNNNDINEANNEIEKFLKNEDFSSALTISTKYSELYPSDFSFFFISGVCYKRLNQKEEAKKFFIKAIELNDDFFPSYDFLIDLLTEDINHSFNKDSFDNYLKKAIELQPLNDDLKYKRALFFIRCFEFLKAKDILIKLFELDDTEIKYLIKLALCYSNIGEGKKSIELIKDFKGDYKVVPELFVQMAIAYQSLEEFSEARKIYYQLLEMDIVKETDEFLHALYTNLSETLRMEKDEKYHTEFNNVCEEALLFFPNNSNTQINRAISNIYLKKREDSLSDIKFLNSTIPYDREVASLSLYLKDFYETDEILNFCHEPFEAIKKFHIKDYYKNYNKLLSDTVEVIKKEKLILDQPFKTDVGALRTATNLANSKEICLIDIMKIIRDASNDYINELKEKQFGYYSDFFPEKYNVNAWSMIADAEAFHIPHNHCEAWFSGILYLEVPKKILKNNGSIIFSTYGFNFPIRKNMKEEVINPLKGELIFFPSHLYHRTLAHKTDSDRICIPFNCLPDKEPG